MILSLKVNESSPIKRSALSTGFPFKASSCFGVLKLDIATPLTSIPESTLNILTSMDSMVTWRLRAFSACWAIISLLMTSIKTMLAIIISAINPPITIASHFKNFFITPSSNVIIVVINVLICIVKHILVTFRVIHYLL